jgi:hypothetical protein
VKLVLSEFLRLEISPLYADRTEAAKRRDRMTYLRCLAVAGVPGVLVKKATDWTGADDQLLTGTNREEARLLRAEGLLNQGDSGAAWSAIYELADGGSSQLTTSSARLAAVLLERVVDATPAAPADVSWPRLQLFAKIRYQVDTEAASTLRERLDGWTRQAGDLSEKIRSEVQALRELLGN